MTETGVVLPWWLMSLFAGVILTVGVWRQDSLRRWGAQRLSGAAERLLRWCNRLELHLARHKIRTDDAFLSFARYLAAMRYQMAVIDFNRLLTTSSARPRELGFVLFSGFYNRVDPALFNRHVFVPSNRCNSHLIVLS